MRIAVFLSILLSMICSPFVGCTINGKPSLSLGEPCSSGFECASGQCLADRCATSSPDAALLPDATLSSDTTIDAPSCCMIGGACGCMIGNICHPDGEINSQDPDQCQVCDPSEQAYAWMPAPGCVIPLVHGATISRNGPLIDASLFGVSALAIWFDGSLLIANGNNIRRVVNGELNTFAGNSEESGERDGPRDPEQLEYALFVQIRSLFLGENSLFVADANRIRKLAATDVVTVGGAPSSDGGISEDGGFVNGTLAESRFDEPSGMSEFDGSIIIADRGNHCLRDLSTSTELVRTTSGKCEHPGNTEGFFFFNVSSAAEYDSPRAIASAGSWYLIIEGAPNNRLKLFRPSDASIYNLTSTGVATSAVGPTPSESFRFETPTDVVGLEPDTNIDGDEIFFVADQTTHQVVAIRQLGPLDVSVGRPTAQITTVAGQFKQPGGTSGRLGQNKLSWPCCLALSSNGKYLYIGSRAAGGVRVLGLSQ